MREPTDLEAAYCAGVIDSDGYIGIRRSTYNMRVAKDATQPVFSERMAVKQVEQGAVRLLHELFGGSFYPEKASAARGKQLWVWMVTNKRAAGAIQSILPFLRIKSRQARNCLELRSLIDQRLRRKGQYRPIGVTNLMEEHYNKARELNKLGAGDGFTTPQQTKPTDGHSVWGCDRGIEKDQIGDDSHCN